MSNVLALYFSCALLITGVHTLKLTKLTESAVCLFLATEEPVDNVILCARMCVNRIECDMIGYNDFYQSCMLLSFSGSNVFAAINDTYYEYYNFTTGRSNANTTVQTTTMGYCDFFETTCYCKMELSLLNWTDAYHECQDNGENISTPTNAEENAFILTLRDTFFTPNSLLWLGANKYGGSDFIWTTGEPWSYTDWGNMQPTALETHQCLSIDPDIGSQWANIECDRNAYFFCEFPC